MANNIRSINSGHPSGLGEYILNYSKYMYYSSGPTVQAYSATSPMISIPDIPAGALVIVYLSAPDFGGGTANGASATNVSVSFMIPPAGNWATYGESYSMKIMLLKTRGSTWYKTSRTRPNKNSWFEVNLNSSGTLQARINNLASEVETVYGYKFMYAVMSPITSAINTKIEVH